MEIKKEETKEKVVHRQRDRTISKKGDSTIKKFGRRSKNALGLGASMGADKVSDYIEGRDDIKAVMDLERDVAVGTASKVKKTKDAVSKIRKRPDINKKVWARKFKVRIMGQWKMYFLSRRKADIAFREFLD